MKYKIERVNESNYRLFDDMVFRRENGTDREVSLPTVSPDVKQELKNTNFYIYAVLLEDKYVGWISLIYIPKVGRWGGHGHIYVDELWVEPSCRRQGLAKALMRKADELKTAMKASGIRLYVNVQNPEARKLYEACGYKEDGQAFFMEKYL